MAMRFGTTSVCSKRSWQANETILHRTTGPVSGLPPPLPHRERLRAVRGGHATVLLGHTPERASDGPHAGTPRPHSTRSRPGAQHHRERSAGVVAPVGAAPRDRYPKPTVIALSGHAHRRPGNTVEIAIDCRNSGGSSDMHVIDLRRQVCVARVIEIRAMGHMQTQSRQRLDHLFTSLLHRTVRGEL